VQRQPDFLQLVPPNPATNPGGPSEIYLVSGESVAGEGIQRPDDPQLVAYLDEQVRLLSPLLQRTSGPVPAKMAAGTGVLLSWEGTNPQGQAICARAFVSILKQYGIGLIALGQKAPVDARDAEVRRIFASFGLGEGQNDPALAGAWDYVSTSSVSNTSPFVPTHERAQSVSETSVRFVFQPDGTFTRTAVSQFIAMGAANPITGGSIVLDSGPEKTVEQGRWNGGEGFLYLVYQDETVSEYEYRVEQSPQGRQLKLVRDGSLEVWAAGQ
jgi:hypothetical protein